ncbi:hypothetical protein K437DRAFT_78150 [Tilletiaria anomala UBC 951]|uniref:Uncharacterized protein n=1 Tax=Tilletiaria anomala (strain ATCC 24038 / CBS 436.72 / UBC 951) TaxID=1037660 RepID=A0A066V177_TILAU|nr:uncharacterized protein K437DRAFT_78150 [Tilletiaria anomala UBC 951]KDN35452.1 hypothetical protein K437DRAFT_78150 [Tilletiaria anomala UBC 951]
MPILYIYTNDVVSLAYHVIHGIGAAYASMQQNLGVSNGAEVEMSTYSTETQQCFKHNVWSDAESQTTGHCTTLLRWQCHKDDSLYHTCIRYPFCLRLNTCFWFNLRIWFMSTRFWPGNRIRSSKCICADRRLRTTQCIWPSIPRCIYQ